MSCNYADGLSPYHDKGQLGLEEKFDSKSVVNAKVGLLAKWINDAKHVVIHTGAGISTSAGIPDFRGPKGVWTLQAKGQKPDISMDFNEAIPTPTHMAIAKLVEKDKAKYVVSQNIDGLHLRSNLPRHFLSELHGNMFTEQCNTCNRQFVRNSAVPTVGQKTLNKACPTIKANGRPCRGRLHDTILDWEHNLPENDLGMADFHSCLADLSLCLGTTMQIVPSGNLPLYTKKNGGKLVICNLQPTKHDRKADLLIHSFVDDVMTLLMKAMNVKIPKYQTKNDPTKSLTLSSDKYFEWTISDLAVKKMRKIYEDKCGTKEAKKRLNVIDDEEVPSSVTKSVKRSKGDVSEKEEEEDLEVVNVIVKNKKNKDSPKRGKKRAITPEYTPTITMKKVPSKKQKYETEKIVIKKNVTPTKTKYEIVPAREKKKVKCEIVYTTDNVCDDLEMICESGSEDEQSTFRCNFKRYLYDDKTLKKEEVKPEETPAADTTNNSKEETNKENTEDKSVKEKESEDRKEVKEKESEDSKEVKETEDSKEAKETEDSKEAKETEDSKEAKETEDSKGAKETEDSKEVKETEDSKEAKESEDCKEVKEDTKPETEETTTKEPEESKEVIEEPKPEADEKTGSSNVEETEKIVENKEDVTDVEVKVVEESKNEEKDSSEKMSVDKQTCETTPEISSEDVNIEVDKLISCVEEGSKVIKQFTSDVDNFISDVVTNESNTTIVAQDNSEQHNKDNNLETEPVLNTTDITHQPLSDLSEYPKALIESEKGETPSDNYKKDDSLAQALFNLDDALPPSTNDNLQTPFNNTPSQSNYTSDYYDNSNSDIEKFLF